jgi:tRNA G10  N-methylase Trm11
MTTTSLFYGDFDIVAGGLPQFDLILTDPPYPRALAVPCFEMLARHAPALLKDGGSLVSIVPHYLVEEVVEILRGALKYRWIYSMDQIEGAHPRLAMGVEVMWKPVLHYVKRAYPHGRGFIKDKLTIPGPQKDRHEWQQHEAWAEFFIAKLTRPGESVLDPFCGAGTVPAVAKRLGRKATGIEIDYPTYQTALERVRAV